MLDIKTLLPELKKLVSELSEDMLKRVSENAELGDGLKHAYQQIEKGGRTAQAYEVWLEDYLDQVAVAWVLACVFVRFMEDNGLIDECWLAGEGQRRKRAEDAHTLYFREHPHESDREYFEHVFKEVGKIPAAAELFAEGKTPLWAVGPTGDAARKLLRFWREIDTDSGDLMRSFKVESGDTRFLGDLYQELSERAKKKYALLQTPVFVEEFILDRTLTPAIDEFGLEKVRMIDPTCGSGHFLLGGFARLFKRWSEPEHTTGNAETDAQKALDGVWGVDINPFAVAIARFRLIVAAVQACGIKRLKKAPGWTIHLATGDSLLFGSRWDRDGNKKSEQQFLGAAEESWAPEIYACEDKEAVREVLGQQYHVVVGNPPYITPKDRAAATEYRRRYSTAYDKYHLSTPFTERFFDLAQSARENMSAGYIGMIKDNAFMKRGFGRKLIEEFFPTVDLTTIVDTSGAFIPGHGTATTMLFGRSRSPASETVRAVLGIKGEPQPPLDASDGFVWKSILRQIDRLDSQDEYTSTADVPRTSFNTHPWSIGGGGVADVMALIEGNADSRLDDHADSIGITCFTLEDDVYLVSEAVSERRQLPRNQLREMVGGDMLRDWMGLPCDLAVFPYDERYRPITDDRCDPLFRYLWAFRTNLSNSKMFGGKTKVQTGLKWYEYGRLTTAKFDTPFSIVFTEITTHNHFVLDRGGKLFAQSAPVIKLPAESTEADHLALLGLLNSSTVCFWAKQVMPCKGLGGQGGGIKPEHWSRAYVFNGTTMGKCPVPANLASVVEVTQNIQRLADKSREYLPSNIVREGVDGLEERLAQGRMEFEKAHRVMVSFQEELDWQVYSLFGLCDLCDSDIEVLEQGLHPEDRPVERSLKRRIQGGESSIFYDVHLYRGTGDRRAPSSEMETLIEQRQSVIEESPQVRLIEHPDFKRRWQMEPWEDQERRALRNWLLDRLEGDHYWSSGGQRAPTLRSTAQLTDSASSDNDFNHVASLYRRRSDFDLSALVAELVAGESVPFLPILRYKPSGLRKRVVWERTWELQRREDIGEDVGEIAVPPKYSTADFQKTDYWRLRGKLDVPKERWISFPHCERDGDPSLVVGWAGWNHLQQATALVAYYDARKREGWTAQRLKPILAGLDQLLPWIHQWHPEVDPDYGETAGQSFQNLLESDAHELGLTLDEIRGWTPPKATSRKRKRKA